MTILLTIPNEWLSWQSQIIVLTITNDNSEHSDCNDNLNNFWYIAKKAEKGDTTTITVPRDDE